MTSVKVRIGEPIDKALRALKKKLDKEGIKHTVFTTSLLSKAGPSLKLQ